MAKLLVHPRGLRIPKKTKKHLADAGYILIAEDEIGSVRVVEPLPEFDTAGDSAWLIRTLLQIVMADDSYAGTKSKFSKRLLKKIEERFVDSGQASLSVVQKAS